jgi:hypothetical protein
MIELAVIRPRAIGLLQMQDRDPPFTRERAHLTAEATTDLPQQRGRRDLEPKMVPQESDRLPAQLERRQVRVQVQPIHAFDLERHVALEHVVEVRHARHPRSMNAKGGLRPPAPSALDGGGREGGLTPSR